MFADDVKMIADPRHPTAIKEDLDRLSEWESIWSLEFNVDKCKVMHLGKANPHNKYLFGEKELSVVHEERDLGVMFSDDLSFQKQIRASISKAKAVSGWLMRTVISRDPHVMTSLYKILIRPHLEYCVQAWAPVARYRNWDIILEIEGVQRSFTRLIEGIGLLTYRDRLERLSLTTLLERRMRGDLIETFKIVSGLADYGAGLFNRSRSGRKLIARSSRTRFTTQKSDFFSQRVLHYWNKLPENVKSSPSVNSFKNRLDNFRAKLSVSVNQGHYWELSDDIFRRIEVSSSDRSNYTQYMKDNPHVAKYKGINIR